MSLGHLLSVLFEKVPELPIKNDIRYFLSFNRIIPKFISDMSPVKGYELYYHLKEGDIVVDAGAYPGDYSVFASRKVGKTGKVICFEPDPRNRKILRRNMEHEGINNFIIVPKGLWNKNTKLKIKYSDGLHTELSQTEGNQEIEVCRLDDELAKLGIKKVDALKMDIEGAEVQAIEGAKKTLENNKVNVMIASYHILNGKTTSFLMEEYLRKIGYNAISDFKKHLTTYGWKN